MAAAEREARAAVIDFNICADTPLGRSGIRHQHRTAYGQKPGNYGPGKEPTSCPTTRLCHFVSDTEHIGRLRQHYCPSIPLHWGFNLNVGILFPTSRCDSQVEIIVGAQSQAGTKQGTYPLQRKHLKLLISIQSGGSEWVDLPRGYRVLPVQNAGQHLQFLQMELSPWLRNVRTHAKDAHRETGAEFALYNPDLRRTDYDQINKPTFL
jgi:hypothetical protein